MKNTVRILGFITTFLLLPKAFAGTQDSVPLWSVYEATFQTQRSYANPYTDISMTATFRGPGGVTKKVSGFWDGGNRFRIRFTPTKKGTWSYITSSPDPGLDAKQGQFTATAASGVTNRGFLRADNQYRTKVVWDDGSYELIWGQTYYSLVQYARKDSGWKNSIDNSRRYGMKKVRLLVYPWIPTVHGDSQPFQGPANRPDHDRLDLAHWRALDDIVQTLERKGMVADLIIFADNKRVFGTMEQDKRYIRYVLSRYAAYHNVIWCLSNEWQYTNKPKSYWNTMGALVRSEDPWITEGGKTRLLSIHQKTQHKFEFSSSSWPSYIVIQDSVRNHDPHFDHGDEWGNYGIRVNMGRRPVFNDEYAYYNPSDKRNPVDRTTQRQAMWGIVAAGGYGTAGSYERLPGCRGDAGHCSAWNTGVWKGGDWYSDIQRMVSFMNGIPFWRMKGDNGVLSGGNRVYALVEPGKRYLVYAATGGTFSLKLPSGTYKVTRYNPRTGESAPLSDVEGGKRVSFSFPDRNDWVLYLSVPEKEPAQGGSDKPLAPPSPPEILKIITQ